MTPVARIERAIKKGDKWALQSHRLRNRTDVWWYVEHNGIGIHIAYDPHGTRPILIPWRSLKAALRRERKKEGR